MLVEEEHVFDRGETDDLEGAEAEAHQQAGSKVELVVLGDGASDCENATSKSRPEDSRAATPPCGDDDPEETPEGTDQVSSEKNGWEVCNLHHEHVEVIRLVHLVRSLVPFQALGHDQWDTGCRVEVTKTGSEGEDGQHERLLGSTPVEGIVRIIGWLRDQDCMAIRRKLQIAIHITSSGVDHEIVTDVLLSLG